VKIHPGTVVVPLAVVLLVGAAGAVLATSAPPSTNTGNRVPAEATATPGATTAPAPTTGPTATTAPTDPGSAPATGPAGPATGPGGSATGPGFRGNLDDTALNAALDKLVAAGTITADQKQAILDAVKAERQARLADRQAQRDALKAQRDQIRGFLSDGQITQDELNQLPADSPLRKLTSLMADGKITVDELRQLGRDLAPGILGGPGRGHGFGFFGPHGGPNQPDASGSPAPTTGG